MVKLDAVEDGWLMVLKDYQVVTMKSLWNSDKGMSSRDVWVQCNIGLQGIKTISRASIINFCNAMVEEGILSFHEITGKGGHRRIYAPMFDEAGTKLFLARLFINKLMAEWPYSTKQAIKTL